VSTYVSEEELKQRSTEWRMPKSNYTSGALAKYAFLVGSAAQGAITDPNNALSDWIGHTDIDRK